MARQLPRGARPSGHPLSSENIFSLSRPLTGRSWVATLFFLYDRTLIYSPPFTRLLILLLLLASGNVHPNPGPPMFAQQIPYIPAPFAPEKLGEPQSNVAAARGESTPPAPSSLGPLSGPCFPGMTRVVGFAHPV